MVYRNAHSHTRLHWLSQEPRGREPLLLEDKPPWWWAPESREQGRDALACFCVCPQTSAAGSARGFGPAHAQLNFGKCHGQPWLAEVVSGHIRRIRNIPDPLLLSCRLGCRIRLGFMYLFPALLYFLESTCCPVKSSRIRETKAWVPPVAGCSAAPATRFGADASAGLVS